MEPKGLLLPPLLQHPSRESSLLTRIIQILFCFFLFVFPWMRWDIPWKIFPFPDVLRDYGATLFTFLLFFLVSLNTGIRTPPFSPFFSHVPTRLPPRDPSFLGLRKGEGGLLLILFFFLWSILSILWSSEAESTRLFLHRLFPWTVLVLCTAILARNLAMRRMLLWALCGMTVATSVMALLMGVFFPESRYGGTRWKWPFENPCILSGFLFFGTTVLSLFAFTFLRSRSWKRAIVAFLFSLPCGIALWFTGSRSTFLGLAAGWGVGWLSFSPPSSRPKRLFLLLAMSLGTLLVGIAWLPTEEGRRFLYENSAGLRFLLIATAWRMAAARPWEGWGAGTFYRSSYLFEKPEDFLHPLRGDAVIEAHSEPMQVLAELGGIGFLLWLAIHVLAFRRLWRPIHHSPLTILILAGLFGLFIDSWFNPAFRFEGSGVFWIYALVLGLAFSQGKVHSRDEGREGKKSVSTHLRYFFFLLHVSGYLLFVFFSIGPAIRTDIAIHKALAIFKTHPSEAAHILASVESGFWSSSIRYFYYEFLSSNLTKAQRRKEIIPIRKKMLAIFPSDPLNRKNLGLLLLRQGHWQEALRLAVEGLLINPYDIYEDEILEDVLRRVSGRKIPCSPSREEEEEIEEEGAMERVGRGEDLFSSFSFLTQEERRGLEARWLWAVGKREEALKTLQEAPYSNLRIGHGALLFARWLTELGRLEEARSVILPVARRIPADPRALVLAAILLSQSDRSEDHEEMLKMVERAVFYGPTLPSAVRLAAYTWILLGNQEQNPALRARAREVAEAAVARKPTHAELHTILIEVLERLGDTKGAAEARARAYRRFPKDPRFQSPPSRHHPSPVESPTVK